MLHAYVVASVQLLLGLGLLQLPSMRLSAHTISICTLAIAAVVAAAQSKPKSDSNGVVKLNDASFAELTQSPREHYTVVLLTALDPQFNCVFCREFDPEFNVLANSWQKSSAKRKGPAVHFGHLDFKDGQNTFRSLSLVSAPNLWIFAPTLDENGETVSAEPIRYDFTNSPRAEPAAAFVSRSIGREFSIQRPFDYVKFMKFSFTISVLVLILLVVYKVAGFIFVNKHFWAAISIFLILVFNGGYMFTQIRNSPYSRGDGYIAGGFQDQFGAETQIVAATCKFLISRDHSKLTCLDGILAFSVVTLAVSVPRIKNPQTQSMLILVWVVVQFFVFSFLMQLFRQKNGGYPFKLLL